MNGIYDVARKRLVTNQLSWLGASMKLVAWSGTKDFVPTDVTTTQITNRALAQNQGVSELMTGQAVANDGTTQSNPVVFKGIAAGKTLTFLTVIFASGNELILYLDDVEGLPYLTNGLDIVVQPDWSQSKGWFRA